MSDAYAQKPMFQLVHLPFSLLLTLMTASEYMKKENPVFSEFGICFILICIVISISQSIIDEFFGFFGWYDGEIEEKDTWINR